jgi:hypothetical protein
VHPLQKTLPIPCYLLCTQDLDLNTQHFIARNAYTCGVWMALDVKEVQVPSSLPFTSVQASHASHRKSQISLTSHSSHLSPLTLQSHLISYGTYKVLQQPGLPNFPPHLPTSIKHQNAFRTIMTAYLHYLLQLL